MSKTIKQYGTWSSPLSPKWLGSSLRLSDVQWDSESDTLVWLEGRGAQGVLVMQQGESASRDLTSDLSVRARVGYGGGDFTVTHGHVYFAGPEGRLYRQALAGGQATAILPAFGQAASPRVSADGRWLAYVHTYEGKDGLALVDVEGKMWPAKLAYGTDFVMQPAWHPGGVCLAYIAWNHPQMPWDGTELHLITFDYDPGGVPGIATNEVLVGDDTTAIFQPEFSPDGRWLAYISDATGWGQIYLYDLDSKTHKQITEVEAEHGEAAWVQGIRSYGWTRDSQSLMYLRNDKGFFSLWCYSLSSGTASRIDQLDDYTSMGQLATSHHSDSVALLASASTIPSRIVTYTAQNMSVPPQLSVESETPSIQVIAEEEAGAVRVRRRSASENLLASQLAEAEAITWKGHDDEDVYGLYYPPTSDEYEGTGKPPLIVMVHGGPTGQRAASYDGSVQFFASRGFAVLQVNYRGSTGYGKAYMNKLRGNWGLYDVEDSASGAQSLVDQGKVDGSKLVIQGGSAGGFTVYQSLIDKPGFYKAGVCLFGVANQFGLAMETHKFEERYLDSMLGPLPDAADLYRERSPLFHAEKIVDPIIVFQGADDQVVPQNQSDDIVASLRARGVTHEYHVYEGEGHGWRKPETIEAYYTSALKFLQQHVLFA